MAAGAYRRQKQLRWTPIFRSIANELKRILVIATVSLVLLYLGGWAIYQTDCDGTAMGWHFDASLQRTHTALCAHPSLIEVGARALIP